MWFFFFLKQKTAYELRISDWSSDVCSSDLNLLFRKTARNFNPACAMAGKVCIVEVEEVVEIGAIDPDHVHLPGIYVDRIVHNPTPEKRRSEEHTSELQSLMRTSYAVFCLKKKQYIASADSGQNIRPRMHT